MPRFIAHIAYNGSRYAGWQRQPNAMTVQEAIENALSTVLQSTTTIIGCGRTDTGVHASHYVFHFDTEAPINFDLAHRLNRMLGMDIYIKKIVPAADTFHARFDARRRTYQYYLIKNKSPFYSEIKTQYPQFHKIDVTLLKKCAELIKSHTEFYPFCKSRTDAESMTCQVFESAWDISTDEYIYTITANRFLRGMVRLIVGMSLRVSIGEIPFEDVVEALENQTRLEKSYSAPANGLFLCAIEY